MLKLEYKPYTLEFKFDARTSRGVMNDHKVIFIKIYDTKNPEIAGFGEVAPLPGLSEESIEDAIESIEEAQEKIGSRPVPTSIGRCLDLAASITSEKYSSVIFGLETALLDLWNGGQKKIFDGTFLEGKEGIPINGLIWMDGIDAMIRQAKEKIDNRFECIKMKVGALDFEEELKVISIIRSQFEGVLRLDANGAFKNNEALGKLSRLADFDIHSIEQPILPRQLEAMQLICARSPVAIALDEELVGITDRSERVELLRFLKPQYIILKPTLHGGLASCMDWIRIADELRIGYWITSALESNIGLNAITQFSAYVGARGYQGLGTGSLYHNNITSPLKIFNGSIYYDHEGVWDPMF